MKEDTGYIKLLLPDFKLSDEDCKFLAEYLTKWLVDEEIDVDSNTIKLLNKNREAIDALKSQYAKDKVMDVLERKITLSQIASGQITITEYARTKDGPIPYERVPSFSERITAINALNALEQIAILNSGETRSIIVDDIPVSIDSNEVKNEEVK